MNFLDKLNKYMKENLIKQKDLVESTGLSKSYISMVLRGDRSPNKELLTALAEMSGQSINWWLNDVEVYNNLHSLNQLLDLLIDTGRIAPDGSMNTQTHDMIQRMLKSEIETKLDAKYNNESTSTDSDKL